MPCPFWFQDDFSFKNARPAPCPSTGTPGRALRMDDPRTATGATCAPRTCSRAAPPTGTSGSRCGSSTSRRRSRSSSRRSRGCSRAAPSTRSRSSSSPTWRAAGPCRPPSSSPPSSARTRSERANCAPPRNSSARAIRRRAQFGGASPPTAHPPPAGTLVEPIFWVMLIILVSTAIFQVVYLNKALENYPSTLVIPLHYVHDLRSPALDLYQSSRLTRQLPPPPAMLFVGGIS